MNEHLPKIQITRHPDVTFGVSIQSPATFQMQNSMISSRSYVNPFIKLDKHQLSKLKHTHSQPYLNNLQYQMTGAQSFLQNKSQLINQNRPQWTSRQHHTNLSTIQNQNGYLTGRKIQKIIPAGLNHSLQLSKNFQDLVNQQNNKYFHKKKGQFTSYLQNHLLNKDFIGPLQGNERTQQKKNHTKQKILLEKCQQLQKTKLKYSFIKPNRSLSPLLEKTKIHRSRLLLNDSVHEKYDEKQNVKLKTRQFELPKINKNELQESLVEIKSNYKKHKNQNLNLSYFMSSLSSIKTADLDRSGLINKSKFS